MICIESLFPGPDAKLALVMTFGMEVQAMKQELLINLIVEVVDYCILKKIRPQNIEKKTKSAN